MRTVVYLLLLLGLWGSFGAIAAHTLFESPNVIHPNAQPKIIRVQKKQKKVNPKANKENCDYRIDLLRKNFSERPTAPCITIAKSKFHVLIDEALAQGSIDGTELENLYDQIGQDNDQFRSADSAKPFIGYVVEHYGNNMWTPALITQLLAHGANPNGINPETGHGPLHLAIYHQQAQLVEQLIAGKANPNSANKDGQTPLHFACMTGNLYMVRFLIEHGADVDARDIKYAAPMHFVVGRSLSKAMPSLFKYPNQRNDRLANNDYSVQIETRKQIIDELCAHSAEFEPIDTDNKTPYDIACQEAHHRLASHIEIKKRAASPSSAATDDGYCTSSTDEEDNNTDY